MYKIETHLHTLPVSACARFQPEEMVRFYKAQGYSTVFISDHFSEHHFSKLGEQLSWREKVEIMYDSFLRAKAEGEKQNINVLFSPELSLCGNHFLLYNSNLDFFKMRDDYFQMTLEEFYHHAKENGITIFQAHPFRDGKCTPQPQWIDGIEAINTNPRHENFDEQALEFAAKLNLPISAGSDAHRTEDIAGAAVLSPSEIKTTEDFLTLIKSGEAKLMKHGKII